MEITVKLGNELSCDSFLLYLTQEQRKTGSVGEFVSELVYRHMYQHELMRVCEECDYYFDPTIIARSLPEGAVKYEAEPVEKCSGCGGKTINTSDYTKRQKASA